MKKVLLLSVGLLCSATVGAQTTSEIITTGKMMEGASFEKEFPLLDLKIFHDRQIMQEVIKKMYDMEQNPPTIDEETLKKTSIDGTDVQKVNASLKNKVNYGLTQKPLEERLQKADEQPFEAFKELMMGVPLPQMNSDDVRTKVKAEDTIKMVQMLTESGTGIGSNQVPVVRNETQNQR